MPFWIDRSTSLRLVPLDARFFFAVVGLFSVVVGEAEGSGEAAGGGEAAGAGAAGAGAAAGAC